MAAGIIESKREARELGQRLEALETVVNERLDRLQRSRSDIVAAGQALDAARQKAHTSELELAMSEKDRQKSESQLEAVVRRLSALAVEEEELISALTEARCEREQCGVGPVRRACANRTAPSGSKSVFQATLVQARGAARRAAKRLCRHVGGTRSIFARSFRRRSPRRGDLPEAPKSFAIGLRGAGEDLTVCADAIAETGAQLASHEDAMRAAERRLSEARQRLFASREVVEQGRAAIVEKEAGLKGLRAALEETRERWQAHEMVLRERSLSNWIT